MRNVKPADAFGDGQGGCADGKGRSADTARVARVTASGAQRKRPREGAVFGRRGRSRRGEVPREPGQIRARRRRETISPQASSPAPNSASVPGSGTVVLGPPETTPVLDPWAQ